MSIRTFEYYKNDIKMLKKDWIMRAILCLCLLAVAGWQGYLLAMEIVRNNLEQFEIISSIFVFASSLIYILLGIVYVHKYRKIISVLNKSGKCVSSVNFIFSVKKLGFIKIYRILTALLTILAIFVLISSSVFVILKYSFYKEISFYYPVLLNLCLIGLYSTLHISTEIKINEKLATLNKL